MLRKHIQFTGKRDLPKAMFRLCEKVTGVNKKETREISNRRTLSSMFHSPHEEPSKGNYKEKKKKKTLLTL